MTVKRSESKKSAVRAIQDLLDSYDISTDTDHLRGTAHRVVRAYDELLRGYQKPDFEFTTFETKSTNLVVIKGIQFHSLCAHHMIPFFGEVHIGYIPNGVIAGLSKFPRYVSWVAAKLQVQEDLTEEIAAGLRERLKPAGLIVVMKARHLCQEIRGAKSHATTTTSCIKGLFRDVPSLRDEFFKVLEL